MPLILLKTKPMYLITKGSIFKYCKIPIKAEIKIIGKRTLIKNENWSLLTSPPNTKFTPSPAQSRRTWNPFAILPTK